MPITTLRLSGGSFAACTAKKARARRARSIFSVAVASSVKGGTGAKRKKPVRKLWGDGRGRFRTKGRYGAATVRGTKWLTADRCDGTLVRVERGKVDVEDLIRPKTRVKRVRAGQKTLVPAKRQVSLGALLAALLASAATAPAPAPERGVAVVLERVGGHGLRAHRGRRRVPPAAERRAPPGAHDGRRPGGPACG